LNILFPFLPNPVYQFPFPFTLLLIFISVPVDFPNRVTVTRRIVLPDAENRTIVSLFVRTQYRNVTDGRTDRRNLSGYYSALHCEQCGRAVKTICIN